MFLSNLILLPALVLALQAPQPAGPPMVEVARGVFVLKGAPTVATYAEIKQRHITRILDLRDDSETVKDAANENTEAQACGAEYQRYAVTRTPPPADFTFVRELLRGAHNARVLIHCSNGNRAAAIAYAWMVLDKGMKPEEAMRICKEAGLQHPDTERVVEAYVKSQAKA
jgi:protein tyrosine phosphatase (PTP) superfamily phosphohydrolase (DUF442 family)